MDVLRLLCWCQNVRPDDLSSISTETERENLITLGLIKRHQRSDTLLLTNSGRAFLQAALEGDVPNLTLSYHDAAIERRVRLSSLMMTAYHAGINVLTITANSLAEPSTLFITAITRSRGHNPWGSARVGAIAHLGSTYYAVHYIYSGIGRMAVNDELAAFHNHTNFGKDTQRAFLFAGASYADIIEELKARDEKRDAKLIRYSEAYPTLKAVCEGRELPAYEAAAEFTAQTSGELDNLLSQLGGKPGAVQTLEKLEQAEKTAEDKLAALLEQLRGAPQDDPALSAAVVKAANDAESKRRQADAVNKLVDAGLAQNQAEAGALIARAVSAAAERAEEVQTILGAWSDAPGDMRKTDANAALLERVRDSKTLQDISRYLGRFREIFAQGKRNGYAYGRGEKYALELGNDLSRALTSELAMLAVPETLPLFLRKYQHRQIKQYRRREPVYKGAGDIICCLDESGSTAGDLAAWGKAVALTLLEIAQSEGRKFALVHFSGPGRFQTDVFLPGQSSLEEKLHAAETFLGGGTDFQTPLAEAERLMREGGFENADIAFITDGECSLPETCVEMLQKAQSELRFTVTGILLDEGNAGMDFSLKPFCQNIYRTSELTGDQIVGEIVLDRV